jgi:hypothetical protein
MKKKMIFCGLIAMMAVSVFSQNEKDFTVSINDSGDGVVITGYTGRQGNIRIPTAVQGMPVKEIGHGAFRGYVAYIGSEHSSLTEITIPDGVTILRSNAFYQCSDLRKVTLPASLKIIEYGAFASCSKLTSIEIPDGVEEIGKDAFSDCKNLATVKMPKNLSKIDEGLFARDVRLRSIVIYDNVTIIGEDAFAFCSSLESVVLSSTISEIQREAFQNCENLVTVTIPDSVTTIKFGLDCFDGCKKTNIASQSALKKRGYKYSF